MGNASEFIKSLEEAADLIIKNGDETLVLAELQDKVQRYDINYNDHFSRPSHSSVEKVSTKEALGELSQVRMVAEMLLVRSINTYRADKYKLIFHSTLNLIKWNLSFDNIDSAFEHCDRICIYIDDALATSADDFNMISTICDIYYHVLNAKLSRKLQISEIQKQIDTFIPFLIVAADKSKYKYNAALIIGQIADSFMANGEPDLACQYYSKVMDLISQIDEQDNVVKREFAAFVGHYSVALLQSSDTDYELVEKNLDMEEMLYEQLHQEIGDIRSKMDLAIAYSHRANYYSTQNDYRNAAFSHLQKICIIKETFLLKENDSVYSEEDRLNSVYKSMQPIINYGILSNDDERAYIYKKVYAVLTDILKQVIDIKLIMYINAFAMEIFKARQGTDDKDAETYLFKKLFFLTLLIKQYGMEDGIVSDLRSTIQEAKPFIDRYGDKLDSDNREIWGLVNRLIYLADNPQKGILARIKNFLANIFK